LRLLPAPMPDRALTHQDQLMPEQTPLETDIRRRIKAAGPMPVGEYMALCLTDRAHGYYTTRDPIGGKGDFITAPEISQMFGELIGLWMGAVWKQMGSPDALRVIELGPGRGTMMQDAMRAMSVLPPFRHAVALHLVEINPVLTTQQQQTLEPLRLPVYWHAAIEEVPKGPAIILANEFFDALPVNQAVKSARGWHQRQVEIDFSGKLAFTYAPEPMPHFERLLPEALRAAPDEAIFEWRDERTAMHIGRRLAAEGGAALIIDYGHAQSAVGDTLQAVANHEFSDALTAPGTVDLTAHVDFEALTRAIEAMGAAGYGTIEQADFLSRLGIETRAASLKAKAPKSVATEIDFAVQRLIGRGSIAMGALFKAAAFTHPQLGAPPGFE
jgi:NADH dehydrogenase [ubiquinone] 1 alpha subcomplex assembly factor 7